MEAFGEFLAGIPDAQHRSRTQKVLTWVAETFPHLVPRIAWKQPMFTDHGTFIIGFSVARHHLAVAPERVTLQRFAADIAQAGYEQTKELFRIPWDKPVDYGLLARLIAFNIEDKATCTTFWRQ